MRILGFLIRKEFLQIFRNKAMLPIIFVMPLIQLVILVNVATFDVKHIPVVVQDNDGTSASRELIQRLDASETIDLMGMVTDSPAAFDVLQQGDARMVVVIPNGFEQRPELQLMVDAVDGLTANLAVQYAMGTLNVMGEGRTKLEGRYRNNPRLDDAQYMVPGILVVLVTMIGGFLSAMNIVRERELGTMEQLNVTPIRKHQFIIAKLMPFWVIALAELAFGILLGYLLFGVEVKGSLVLIFGSAMIYMLAILGLGLFISTLADTQQQAMLVAWFMMVVFILMGGLFTPVTSMPEWAQIVTWFNPVMWFMDLMRRVMLVGASLADVWKTLVILTMFAVALNTAAVVRYRKAV